MSSALNTMTEVRALSKAPNPHWLPTALCVCVCVCVCVTVCDTVRETVCT